MVVSKSEAVKDINTVTLVLLSIYLYYDSVLLDKQLQNVTYGPSKSHESLIFG